MNPANIGTVATIQEYQDWVSYELILETVEGAPTGLMARIYVYPHNYKVRIGDCVGFGGAEAIWKGKTFYILLRNDAGRIKPLFSEDG